MKMEFKKPEMLISLFCTEDIVTASNNASDAMNAIKSAAGGNTVNTLNADFSSLNFNMAN